MRSPLHHIPRRTPDCVIRVCVILLACPEVAESGPGARVSGIPNSPHDVPGASVDAAGVGSRLMNVTVATFFFQTQSHAAPLPPPPPDGRTPVARNRPTVVLVGVHQTFKFCCRGGRSSGRGIARYSGAPSIRFCYGQLLLR